MSKKLYSFYVDCGRMGYLEGVFLAKAEEIDKHKIENTEIYFGEVLGKHSEIVSDFSKCNIEEVEATQNFLEEFEKLFPEGIGYNPLDYLDD